jgi:hypothetical protein
MSERKANRRPDSIQDIQNDMAAVVDEAIEKTIKEAVRDPNAAKAEDKSSKDAPVVHDLGKEVFKAFVDWKKLADWRSESGMPVLSFIDVYVALGLTAPMTEWKNDRGMDVIPQMQIGCTYGTLNQLKALLKENWEWWPVVLKGNAQLEWKDGWKHEKRRSPHSLTHVIESSLAMDANQYGPFIAEHKTSVNDDNWIWFHDRERVKDEL